MFYHWIRKYQSQKCDAKKII